MGKGQTMTILALRTDKPEAELYLYEDSQKLAESKWQAHRRLAETIHQKIVVILQGRALQEVEGVVVFKGPGSFTGLRIGMSAANALVYSLDIPIVSAAGEEWLKEGIKRLENGDNERIAVPDYGRPAHTTQPKK